MITRVGTLGAGLVAGWGSVFLAGAGVVPVAIGLVGVVAVGLAGGRMVTLGLLHLGKGGGYGSRGSRVRQGASWTSFRPVIPERLVDTRSGHADSTHPLGEGEALTFRVCGRGGVPIDGVEAVAVMVGVVEPSQDSEVRVWPAGHQPPVRPTVTCVAGQSIAHSTFVGVDHDGLVCISNGAGSTHVVVDILGWFPAGGEYTAVEPAGLDDPGPAGVGLVEHLGPGEVRSVQVSGRGGVPDSGVRAVALRVSVSGASEGSSLTLWASDLSRPPIPALSFSPGQSLADTLISALSPPGELKLFNAAGSVDIGLEVIGWFAEGGDFSPLVPARIVDTRSGVGVVAQPLGAGETVVVQVAGCGGVPETGVGSVVATVGVSEPTVKSFLAAWPAHRARPRSSVLNFRAGESLMNTTPLALSPKGQIRLFNRGGATHVTVDVCGWFPEPPEALPGESLLD